MLNLNKKLEGNIIEVLQKKKRGMTHLDITKEVGALYTSSVYQALKRMIKKELISKDWDDELETYIYSLYD